MAQVNRILSSPTSLGGISLANRVVMAPLTRMRAGPGFVPSTLAAEYYSQRAGAGLVIVEATQISQLGMGYPCTPGIYTSEQTAAWKEVVSAVHAKGGKVVMQLWHVGRISHSAHHPEDGLSVAPSAIAPNDGGKVFTPAFAQVDFETPRAMTEDEIKSTIADYVTGAKNSLEAGFDGVEIHAANGYLLDQFLEDNTNQRTDKYGGSVENRMRFLCEVIEAVSQVYPSNCIGVRFSPYGLFNDMHESDPVGLFSAVFSKMNDYDLSYLHVIEPRSTFAGGGEQVLEDAPRSSAAFRKCYTGKIITAGGYTQADATATLEKGDADAVAFGRLYISNPDLAERFAKSDDAKLNPYDRSTFYGGGAEGYTTGYPTMDQAQE